ncbi:MAG: alpha/beta hydrolase [Rhodoferax sp.]|nr:alpha/beta hydrolase [Rhodoferax sp.]
MQPMEPFFREEGVGSGVVCVHSNASSCSQWRALMTHLAPNFHVLAADSYGAGKSPRWPTDRTVTLSDEVALLEPVMTRAGDPFVLVGHSYGAAVALLAALMQPRRVRCLVLYEPTLFALLDAESSPPNDAEGIRQTVLSVALELAAGKRDAAAERFIDYWMGAGSWASMPAPRRAPIEASVANIEGWATALFGEPTPLSAFKALKLPVLLLVGKNSPVSSRSVARLLAQALPDVRVVELDGLGHMGPITHPEIVNSAIAAFLAS